VEILDQRIREELVARVETDPSALVICTRTARHSCITIVALMVAFAAGFLLGSWWFS
jgi:hypothetical protein